MRLILRRFALALLVSAVVSPLSARADAGDNTFTSAAGHYGARRWDQACREFQKLLAEQPDHRRASQARFFYGEALSQLGRQADARAQFDELLKRDPENRYARQALFRSGEAAWLDNDARAAKRDLLAFRQKYPQDELNAYALVYLAHLSARDENVPDAQKLYGTALEQFPNGPLADECRLGLAECQQQSGALDDARRGFQKLIDAKSPLADQALLRLASLDNSQGNHDAARQSLERLLADYPQTPLAGQANLSRGYALYKLGRYPQAEAALRPLLGQEKQSVEAHYWLGLSQKAQSHWSEAAKTFLAVGPQDEPHRLGAALGFQAGDALRHAQQYPAARDQFDRVLATWPASPWADDCLYGKLRTSVEQHEHAECVQLADDFLGRFADSPLRPAVQLAKGHALVAQQQYTEAVTPLEACLQAADLSAAMRTQAQTALVQCLAESGRFADARQTLDQMRTDKARPEVISQACDVLAEKAYAQGELPQAQELFQVLAAESDPDTKAKGLSGVGWCQYKAEQWPEAAATFDRLLIDAPRSPLAVEAGIMRGQALEHMEQFELALATYQKVLARYATNERAGEVLWRAARLRDQQHQSKQAIELYQRLVTQYPQSAEAEQAIYRWATLLKDSGKTDEAAALFERLRKDFPNSALASDAGLRLAERAINAKKYDEAEPLLAELVSAETSAEIRPHALYLQGRLAVAQQKWDDASTTLKELIDTYPNSELLEPATRLLAESSLAQGKVEQAAEQLNTLAAKTKSSHEPGSAAVELRRAQAMAQLKEWGQALEIAGAIETQFPDFDRQYEVDLLLGRCLAAQAQFAEAREAYQKVIESEAGSATQSGAMARWLVGETYFHQESYTQALSAYLKVDDAHPRWYCAALLQAGKCHEMLGQWSQAIELYDRLLQATPEKEVGDEARRHLEVAQQHLAAPKQKLK